VRKEIFVRRYAAGRDAGMPLQVVVATGIHPGESAHRTLIGLDVAIATDASPIAAGGKTKEKGECPEKSQSFHD
jgi:hypothetical protein